MKGQRFHQQKRIEMKTEQCERSLRKSATLFHSSLNKRAIVITWLYHYVNACATHIGGLLGPNSVERVIIPQIFLKDDQDDSVW